MVKSIFPRKISSRIVLLILFILMSNAVLTGIFSQQYFMQVSQDKAAQALQAMMNYITLHDTPEKIGQVLDSYDIEHVETPPDNLFVTTNPTLLELSKSFNHVNETITFYENPATPKILYIAYQANQKPIYWITMPQVPIEKTGMIIAYFEEIIIVLIIFVGSYMTARTINAPLRNIMRTLNLFGSGSIPPPVEEEGPSEIKQLAKSVNQMIRNQYALEKERELMLAGISHDLRTPLTRLQLLAELSTASEESVSAMKEEINQITKMQQQFIDYVSASNHEPEDWVNLQEFCQDLANKYKLSKQYITIQNNASPNLIIKTQPIGLYRILTNAINNAVKYGEAPYTIEITQVGKRVTLNIIDHGLGVSQETLSQMFKPLYRGNRARKNADGSGLGLAIVSRIVERLGGELRAHNMHPQGFCLSITFAT